MKRRVLFVGRTRYSLPLDPPLARKWDALAEALDLRVLARAADGSGSGDPRFELVPPVRPRRLDGAAFYAALPFRLVRELRRTRPDAVMTQSPYEAAAALAARRIAGVQTRVVVELHGDWGTATRLYGSPLRRALEPLTEPVARAALRRADVLRTISDYTTNLIRPLGREPAAVYPAYVDLTAFLARPPQPLPAEPSALFVGVLERYKGVDVLDSAWRAVAARLPDVRLRVVGEGRDARRVEALAADLPGTVHWTPRVDAEEVARALDEATVLLLPSRSEGLPRIVIEAFCRGRPVIGSRAGGIPDIVEDGVSGLLIPSESPAELADAAVRVLSDGALASRLATGARNAAAAWQQTPEEFAGRTLQLVERALAP